MSDNYIKADVWCSGTEEWSPVVMKTDEFMAMVKRGEDRVHQKRMSEREYLVVRDDLGRWFRSTGTRDNK